MSAGQQAAAAPGAESARAPGAGIEVYPAQSAEPRAGPARRFDYLPVSLFALVMGLSGLSISWRLAERLWGAPAILSQGLAVIAIAAFVILAVAYLAKVLAAPDAVAAEFHHPVTGNLFGTIIISLLLLPILLADVAPRAAFLLWCGGAAAMFGFAWLTINRWMSGRQHAIHATPAWIVPVIGIMDIPLAAPALAPAPDRTFLIACLAIAFFFALPLFTIIFSRLVFGRPLPPAMQPALLILVAPPSIGFSVYVSIGGAVDAFATGLYGLMLFLLLILLGRLRYLPRCCPFRVAWWTVSFPLAACATAALRFATERPGVFPNLIAMLLLALASGVIAVLLVRTILGAARGELRALSS